KVQWERFLLQVATGTPFPHDFYEGAKGVQLAELALQSWRERRWVDVPRLDALPTRIVGAQHAAPLHRSDPKPRTLKLPRRDGTLAPYTMREPVVWSRPAGPIRSRVAYAAAHVVCDPLAGGDPLGGAQLDWDATLAYRRHLWGYGLGVAEAMDTAQRGMGLAWPAAQELIRRSAAEAAAVGGRLVCGAQTDQLEPGSARTLHEVVNAYLEQCAFVEAQGAGLVLMCSRELVRLARGPDDYLEVYGAVLSQLQRPAIVHWLGEVFDPELAGYWGHAAPEPAMEVCLALAREWQSKVEGFKLSLLDQQLEIRMRARLPAGMR